MTKAMTEQRTETTTVWIWTESEQDNFGDELASFFVARCDDDGEPTGRIVKFHSYDHAYDEAERVARIEGLELIDDAVW